MTDEELMMEVLAAEELVRLEEETITDVWTVFGGKELKRIEKHECGENEKKE